MVRNPRKKGVAFETKLVRLLTQAGLAATRLPEGGAADEGDLEAHLHNGTRLVVEAKHRTSLPIHKTLQKTIDKTARRQTGSISAVVWQKSTVKPGNTKQSPDGPPVIILTLDDFLTACSHNTPY